VTRDEPARGVEHDAIGGFDRGTGGGNYPAKIKEPVPHSHYDSSQFAGLPDPVREANPCCQGDYIPGPQSPCFGSTVLIRPVVVMDVIRPVPHHQPRLPCADSADPERTHVGEVKTRCYTCMYARRVG